MNCGEFRRWFAILLSGGDSATWPEREYHLHSLRCPACQLLLSTNEITQAVTDVASMGVCSVDEMLIGEQVLRRVQRKIGYRRVLRRAFAAVSLGVVILLAVFYWGGGKAEEVSQREPAEVAVLTKTPEEYARGLANEDFGFRVAFAVKTSKALMFVFDRRNPDADQYEFVKSVVFSGFEGEFAEAPLLTVSINAQDGDNLLKVDVEREMVMRLGVEARGISGTQLCRYLRVLHDLDGRSLPQEEDRE